MTPAAMPRKRPVWQHRVVRGNYGQKHVPAQFNRQLTEQVRVDKDNDNEQERQR